MRILQAWLMQLCNSSTEKLLSLCRVLSRSSVSEFLKSSSQKAAVTLQNCLNFFFFLVQNNSKWLKYFFKGLRYLCLLYFSLLILQYNIKNSYHKSDPVVSADLGTITPTHWDWKLQCIWCCANLHRHRTMN